MSYEKTARRLRSRLHDLNCLMLADFLRRIEVNPASFDELTLREVARFLEHAGGEEMDAIAQALGVSFEAVRESALREIGGNRKEDPDNG